MRVALAFLAILGSCGLHPGLDYQDSGAGTLSLVSVEPACGPTEGGNEVTLSGSGFTGTVGVTFGRGSVTPTVVDPSTLTVVAPYAGVEAVVDVTVTSDLGTFTLDGAYTFTDGVCDGTGDTGTEATGLTGGLVQYTWLVTGCPTCFGLAAGQYESIVATAGFHSPEAGSWVGWFPAPGTCVDNPIPSSPTSPFYDVGDWAYLTSGSVNIGLQRVITEDSILYEAQVADSADFLKSAQYTLSVPDNDALGPFTVTNALQTPQTISDIQPIEILNDDGNPRSPPFSPVSCRSRGLTLTWAPYGGNGYFMVQVDVYNGSSGMYQGTILCREWDDGTVTVPAASFAPYRVGDLLAIYANRYEIGSAILPVNGSTLEGVASIGVLGTGSIAN